MAHVPAPQRLDLVGSEVDVRAVLRGWAAASLPHQAGPAAALKRTVLRCLLLRSLRLTAAGGYELHAVAIQQVGEELAPALAAHGEQRVLYKTAGHTLNELVHSLRQAGIVTVTTIGQHHIVAAVTQRWLRRAGGGAHHAAPLPAQLPLPVALPPAGSAASGAAERAFVELDIRQYPRILNSNTSCSPGQFIYHTSFTIHKSIGGNSAELQLQEYALGTLLRLGVRKVDTSVFHIEPVAVAAAEQHLPSALQGAKQGAAMRQCFRTQYGSSFLAVISDQPCSQYVQTQTLGGAPHALLLLDRIADAVERPSAAAAANGAGPSSAATAGGVTAQLAGLRLANGAGSSSTAAAAAARAAPAVPNAPPQARLVTTEQAAAAAVAELMMAGEVAMDCEGDLRWAGSISLVQLYAPGAQAAGGGASPCYVFDLLAMGPEVRAAAVGHLKLLLESADTIKVLHDCRADSEALFYLHGIRLTSVYDTQVAFGVLQFLSALGGGVGQDSVNAPIGLNQLLGQYQLPLNGLKKAMHVRMDRDPQLFVRRPLEHDVLAYAVMDVWQLLPAKACLDADLGPAASAQVEALSAAYSEWELEPSDRRAAAAGDGSYAGAVRLQLGKDMMLSFDPSSHRPRYTPALPAAESEDAAGAAAPAAPQLRAAGDPDTQLILELFPAEVRAAILAKLAEEEEQVAAAEAAEAAEAASLAAEGQGQEEGSEAGSAAAASAGVPGGSGTSTAVQLVEVVVDVGRPVIVRLSSRQARELDVQFSVEDALSYLAAAKGRLHLGDGSHEDLFYSDNRCGIPGTLHRISCMRDRTGGIIGLTYRVGRHVPGVGRLILDILHALAEGHDAQGHEAQDAVSPSLLLLGGPGVGKTTLLRDVAALLSDTFFKAVVVVDTSNEVAGDAQVAHDCIGRARRMMVTHKRAQHETMMEAVANHNPDVVIIDEIGLSREVSAAKSIAHRGIALVGTAHGRSLEALMRNGELNGLIGGLQSVILGDAEAKQSNGGVKTRTERAGEPAFSTLVEVLSRNCWRVHMSVARSVDALLAGRTPVTQLRWVDSHGNMMVRLEGQPEGRASAGGMRAAVGEAAGRLRGQGRWLQGLLELVAQQ